MSQICIAHTQSRPAHSREMPLNHYKCCTFMNILSWLLTSAHEAVMYEIPWFGAGRDANAACCLYNASYITHTVTVSLHERKDSVTVSSIMQINSNRGLMLDVVFRSDYMRGLRTINITCAWIVRCPVFTVILWMAGSGKNYKQM